MDTTITPNRRKGMTAFGIVWIGQLISFIGSGLTSFAVGVWVYQTNGSITQFALISLLIFLPRVILGPLAGTLVDRWNRRQVMILSDIGGGLSVLFILLPFLFGRLTLWEIYLSVFISGVFDTLRWPALAAATTQLVPKQQFGRASGLLQIVQAGTVLISPLLAGLWIGALGLQGIVLVDLGTYLFAAATLSFIHIPNPPSSEEGRKGKGSLLQETLFGWRYITSRTGLFALMLFFSVANFLMQVSEVLFTPLFLSFSTPAALGTAMSLGGIGYLLGSVVMSIWGGGKRLANTLIISMFLFSFFMGMIGLRPSFPLITFSIFMLTFFVPIYSATNQVIWQNKVAPDLQGRVFAIRQAITLTTPIIASLVAGPLADSIFEPLMSVHGPLANNIGRIIGTGPGRGAGLLLVCMGLLLMLASVISYLYPRLRLLEDELPDMTPDMIAGMETRDSVSSAAFQQASPAS